MNEPNETETPPIPEETKQPEAGEQEVKQPDDKAPKADDNSQVAAPPPKKYKVKVKGEEFEVDENELVKGYQRAQAANQQFQEAKRLHDAAMSQVSPWIENPLAARIAATKDVLGEAAAREEAFRIAEEFLGQALQEKMLPPEKREVEQARREVARLKAENERFLQAQQEAKEKAEAFQHQQVWEQEMGAAMKSANLPDDDHTWEIMIPLIRSALEQNYPLTAEEAVDIVKEKRDMRLNSILKDLPDEAILADEERVKRLNKKILEKLQNKAPSSTGVAAASQNGSTKPQRRAESAKVSASDFFGFR